MMWTQIILDGLFIVGICFLLSNLKAAMGFISQNQDTILDILRREHVNMRKKQERGNDE